MELSIKSIVFITIALTINGLGGLVGGLIPSPWLHNHLHSILAAAAGVLLGTAFLDLLPEAFHYAEMLELAHYESSIFGAALLGFLVFFIVEISLGSHATGQHAHKHDHAGPLILVGDALHNIADGVAIASAFFIDTSLGCITTFTVIVHELPQEIADYSILIARGWSKQKALLSLLLVQGSSFVGALLTLYASENMKFAIPLLLSFSAGGFIYVAAADLLPSLQRLSNDDENPAFKRVIFFFAGIAIMYLLAMTHSHGHGH